MWKIIHDGGYSTEPIELRELKLQLANNSCKCKLCAVHNPSLESDLGFSCYDKEVQVTNSRGSLDRCSQVLHHKKSLAKGNSFYQDEFCPGCRMAMSLIRNVYPKVLKDEESEIKPEMTKSDKSIERSVSLAEKSTSTLDKLTCDHSKISLSDIKSEYSSDKSTIFIGKRNNDKVTFEEIPVGIPKKYPVMSRNCHCMDNFVNSIRPPLAKDFMRF
ncbi:uncharacterized protein LOC120629881 [Pararge aegeria]|uniref:Jg16345 protein n=1 Tax=Pararge aegeria aegeria TaxID=348720 RepID=A0A8S4RXC1_9NEOP|nr:uncharacterized protein LOC120629881 [Pararge aegeria]CAH2241783.1 jg16345 [Pararge aegeria aegeria]